MNLRPYVQSFVVNGENAKNGLFYRPFGTVIAKDELIVLQEGREGGIVHKIILVGFFAW